jgi:hypothetical protein
MEGADNIDGLERAYRHERGLMVPTVEDEAGQAARREHGEGVRGHEADGEDLCARFWYCRIQDCPETARTLRLSKSTRAMRSLTHVGSSGLSATRTLRWRGSAVSCWWKTQRKAAWIRACVSCSQLGPKPARAEVDDDLRALRHDPELVSSRRTRSSVPYSDVRARIEAVRLEGSGDGEMPAGRASRGVRSGVDALADGVALAMAVQSASWWLSVLSALA